MKFSESWLRELVNPTISREQLCTQLTYAGLEIEEFAPVAGDFSGVVVGNVLSLVKHPEADRLNICEVDIGDGKPLSIVCGASNVRAGMRVAVAIEGATLPNDLVIKATKLRGVPSCGMLCSARELGLAEESEGLFELPADAPLGKAVREYLQLDDYFIDVSITPNRGDCLSILGMAKEVVALTECEIRLPDVHEIKATTTASLAVKIQAEEGCPRYVGRVINQVKADAVTPVWLREKLRRSGLRSISPIVDVTNYVMLELGQPMHAFSLDKIAGGIDVRISKAGETLKLLDGNEVKLDGETLIIADKDKPLAIAGVMGGLDSGVTATTQDIFLESAFFQPAMIARAGRCYNLSSDSAYRFERGIDPLLQRQAILRATQLLLEIVGGKVGPVIEVSNEKYLPQPAAINLRIARIEKILGCKVPDSEVAAIMQRLGFQCEKSSTEAVFHVTVPARRSDVTAEIDLIEEVVRIYGYDKIPCHFPNAALQIHSSPEKNIPLQKIRRALCDLGYQEVVTYSFIDKKLQALFEPEQPLKELVNPITNDMGVMRASILPSLVNTLLYNQNRQQSRVRIFETGLRFLIQAGQLIQQRTISGLVSGTAAPEQWGTPDRAVDFFDLKGDLHNLFKLTLAAEEFTFKPFQHSALHPGQTAGVYRSGEFVGVIGMIHPGIAQSLKMDAKVFVFELALDLLETARVPRFSGLSRFPEIRRDIAILLDQSIPAQDIQDTIRQEVGDLLKDVDIFDLYQGKGIEPGQKSIALALTLQHSSRTLVDEEVVDLMGRVMVALKGRFNAELRG
jgi:phenylalanyl-tRNA synthetase beta chain